MVTIHDSIAEIYERSGHAAWAARERKQAVVAPDTCAAPRPSASFVGDAIAVLWMPHWPEPMPSRATGGRGRHASWRARRTRTSIRSPTRRSAARPARRSHRAEDRHQDAVTELTVALKLAPENPLTFELATACYAARNYERALASVTPLLQARPDDPRFVNSRGIRCHSYGGSTKPCRSSSARLRSTQDPGPQLALGRAHVQRGDYAAAITLLEPHLASDADGSLHVQLARAYRCRSAGEGCGAARTIGGVASRVRRAKHAGRTAEDRTATVTQNAIESRPKGLPAIGMSSFRDVENAIDLDIVNRLPDPDGQSTSTRTGPACSPSPKCSPACEDDAYPIAVVIVRTWLPTMTPR